MTPLHLMLISRQSAGVNVIWANCVAAVVPDGLAAAANLSLSPAWRRTEAY